MFGVRWIFTSLSNVFPTRESLTARDVVDANSPLPFSQATRARASTLSAKSPMKATAAEIAAIQDFLGERIKALLAAGEARADACEVAMNEAIKALFDGRPPDDGAPPRTARPSASHAQPARHPLRQPDPRTI